MTDEIKWKAGDLPDDGQIAMPGFDSELLTAEDIKHQIGLVLNEIDSLHIPDYYVLAGRREWVDMSLPVIFSEAAARLGIDPNQLEKADKFTLVQAMVIDEVAKEMMNDQIAKLEAFNRSVYVKAIAYLIPFKGNYEDPGDITSLENFDPNAEPISLKEQAVIYFFAKHPELSPSDETQLTEDHKRELYQAYRKLDSFYADHERLQDKSEMLLAFCDQNTQESANAILSKIRLVEGLRPISHIMPNNALINKMQSSDCINAGDFDLSVSQRNNRKEITAYTMVTMDIQSAADSGIKITPVKLSEYERQVTDSVVSLYEEAIKRSLPTIFTVDQIFRAMPGGGEKPSPGQKAAITKAMERFSFLHIFMDATEEMRKRNIIGSNEKYILDENYLHWRRHTVTTKNGKKIAQGYEILDQPIMLTYSKITNQLLTVPARNIAIEKVKNGRPSGEIITMTQDRQAMTGNIIRRIEIMKHDLKEAKKKFRNYENKRMKNKTLDKKQLSDFLPFPHFNTISFDTLFSEAGVSTSDRKQTMKNRDFCCAVLDYQKAIGVISGYEILKNGKSITGIKITL